MPEARSGPAADTPLTASAAAPISLTALSPLEQGDAIRGLSLAIAGVGPALEANLPDGQWPLDVGPSDSWAVAVESQTGWYVLLSQDCDVVRDPLDEPTLAVAPLTLVDLDQWTNLLRNGYSSRRFAFPTEKFSGLPDGTGLVVDLAWTTSVLKGSLTAPGIMAVRPLTGPKKAAFSEWLSARAGRAPFPDDVAIKVLDPCYDVRSRLSSSFDKALARGGTPSLDARAVAAVEQWYAHRDGMLVTILGQVTGPRLHAAGLVDGSGVVLADDLERGRARLEAEIVKRMNRVDPHSGYQLQVRFRDLALVSAADFLRFSLLIR